MFIAQNNTRHRFSFRTFAISVFLALLAMPSAAWASGSLNCSFENEKASFFFSSTMTHGEIQSRPFDIRGKLELKGKTISPFLAKTDIADPMLAQSWIDEEEIHLLFYIVKYPPGTDLSLIHI